MQIILKILSDYLNSRKTVINEEIDWDDLFVMAQRHKIENIIFYQCKENMPKEYMIKFSYLLTFQKKFFQRQIDEFCKIEELFNKNKIPFFLVKGFEIADFYHKPFHRTMGDLDIVVHEQDKEKVDSMLTDMGFKNTEKGLCEWAYEKSGIIIEIHNSLLYEKKKHLYPEEALKYFEYIWMHTYPLTDTIRERLDDDFYLLYLLLHLQQHFRHEGVGVQLFVDLALSLQNFSIDWDNFTKVLKKLQLLEFATLCFTLCKIWFGITVPLSKEISQDFLSECTDKILSNCKFGSGDDGEDDMLIAMIRKHGKGKLVLTTVFPPFSELIQTKRYTFLKGKAFLLPIAWVYHIYRGLRYNSNYFKVSNKAKFENYDDELKKWGL